jgi:hypothetical protein
MGDLGGARSGLGRNRSCVRMMCTHEVRPGGLLWHQLLIKIDLIDDVRSVVRQLHGCVDVVSDTNLEVRGR